MNDNITTLSVFESVSGFEQAQRMVAPLAQSDLVPTIYKNNPANCMIALETSYRLGESVLTVMQNTSIIYGKPGLDAKFVIALINSRGKFSEPLDFEYTGEGDDRKCYAFTTRKGKVIKGPECTIKMAKEQGWFTKSGSKWPSMPDLMLAYRAATFFGRLHCPEVTMGMPTIDEIIDIGSLDAAPVVSNTISSINNAVEPKAEDDGHAFEELPKEAAAVEVVQPETVSGPQQEDADF